MSISPEPEKGLRLQFGRFSPIRSWHGGGNFWNHEFQTTVRSGALAEFLPRALEDENTVLFEYRSGGEELASKSQAVSSLSEIPTKQLNALRAAVEELKQKADDPHCDRTKRQMIEGFRLPDPERDRDLYRLVGKGGSAKLIVLWGLEREEGSALAPGAAVDIMHTPRGSEDGDDIGPGSPKKKSSSAGLVIAVLVLILIGGGWYFWDQAKQRDLESSQLAAGAVDAAEAERISAFNAGAASMTQEGSGDSDDLEITPEVALEEGTLLTDDEGKITGVSGKDGEVVPVETSVGVDEKGKVSSAPKAGEVVKGEDGKVAGVVGKDGKVVKAVPGADVVAKEGEAVKAPAGAIVKDSKGEVKGVVDRDGKVASADPGTKTDSDGKITAAKPGKVFRNEKGSVTGLADKTGKVSSVKPGVVAKRTESKTASKSGAPSLAKTNSSDKSKSGAGSKPSPKGKGDSVSKSGAPASTGGKTSPSERERKLNPLVRDKSGTVTGVKNQTGKVTPISSGTIVNKSGIVSSKKPGTVVRDSSGRVTGVVGPDGKVVAVKRGAVVEAEKGATVSAPEGTIVRNRTGGFNGVVDRSGKVVAARAGTVIDKDGKVIRGAPGSVFQNSKGQLNGVGGSDGRIVDVKPDELNDAKSGEAAPTISSGAHPAAGPEVQAPDTITTPMTTQGPPPAGISSLSVVSTSLSEVLSNGKVEVLLNVVARDMTGSVVNAPSISEWQVDGDVIQGQDGAPAAGPVLPVSLTPGVHQISTVGRGADDKEFQTDAEVTVAPKP